MSEEKFIYVQNLSKRYYIGKQEVNALNDVSLEIKQGSMLAVEGSSGSGKSTLLHMLGGLDTPTEGSVFYGGQDIFRWKDKRISKFRRRETGFVFQFFNLFPELTVQENIILPLKMDKQKLDEAYFKKLIDVMGLNERLKHRPEQLSGGQQQRVSIARALIHRPRILLCDEPTGNLDERNGDEVIGLLKWANEEWGQTIVIVTHDQKVAGKCDEKITIRDGRLG